MPASSLIVPVVFFFGLKNHAPEDFAETSKQEHIVTTHELSLDERRERALQHLSQVFIEPPKVIEAMAFSRGKVNGHADG